jgi:hypothetical protein
LRGAEITLATPPKHEELAILAQWVRFGITIAAMLAALAGFMLLPSPWGMDRAVCDVADGRHRGGAPF